jgi:hypothetical protein
VLEIAVTVATDNNLTEVKFTVPLKLRASQCPAIDCLQSWFENDSAPIVYEQLLEFVKTAFENPDLARANVEDRHMKSAIYQVRPHASIFL